MLANRRWWWPLETLAQHWIAFWVHLETITIERHHPKLQTLVLYVCTILMVSYWLWVYDLPSVIGKLCPSVCFGCCPLLSAAGWCVYSVLWRPVIQWETPVAVKWQWCSLYCTLLQFLLALSGRPKPARFASYSCEPGIIHHIMLDWWGFIMHVLCQTMLLSVHNV